MNTWPLQSKCDEFYGNPRGNGGTVCPKWFDENIVHVKVPFAMHMGSDKIWNISIHRKCAASLLTVLQRVTTPILQRNDPKDNEFDGSFCFRKMRGGNNLSMHSWGCAIDLDAANNPLGSHKFRFTADHPWVKEFKAEGWTWGGEWTSPDAMHFQAARVR